MALAVLAVISLASGHFPAATARAQQAVPQDDPRFFPQTGYRIGRDDFFDPIWSTLADCCMVCCLGQGRRVGAFVPLIWDSSTPARALPAPLALRLIEHARQTPWSS